MSEKFIDYSKMIDDAMHIIVINSLKYVQKEGLPGKHHFFISFSTEHPEVSISETLKEKYPEEMTIVLQHQFENLIIEDDFFSVVLSFNSKKEKLLVPFKSLVAFADPSVKFGLQFKIYNEYDESGEDDIAEISNNLKFQDKKDSLDSDIKESHSSKSGNIVSLDNFRNK